MYVINFNNQSYTLALHKVKELPTSLYLKLNITASVQKMDFFFIHTGLKSLVPFINSTIHNAV